MIPKEIVISLYKKWTACDPIDISGMPGSGSDRKYFRIYGHDRTLLGVVNPNKEENDAFTGMTYHFRKLGLPVPAVLKNYPEHSCYFIEDLGDTNLYTWLERKKQTGGFDEDALLLYTRVLEKLVDFQIEGIKGLDLEICTPHRSFDRQSMMWDLNYFKYMFLKLVNAPFNEKKLEKDFNSLCDFLLEADQDYFLYRDFQSANIMIVDNNPWFIDYQGGRKGAAQYDPASLLFDSKAHIPQEAREMLIEKYIEFFCGKTGMSENTFRKYYPGFILIRILQALGAFGYRGLYEQKPGFVQSITPGIRNINAVIQSGTIAVELPELFRILMEIPGLERFSSLEEPQKLKLMITSFSYMNGLPHDKVHGGGFIYDCRGLPNPARIEKLRKLSGLDQEVCEYMSSEKEVADFITDAENMVSRSLNAYKKKNYTSLTVAFGCTKGQHRSVYCAETLLKYLNELEGVDIEVIHRDIFS